MVLPNFICLGVGKAGTTSLHYLLRQHPEVLLVPEKEANFFSDDSNYEKGHAWYAGKFSAYQQQRFVGDISPSYFYNASSFERIAECCGTNVKLILILRQPVRRAFSHYLHHVRLFETNQSFLSDLDGENPLLRTASTYAERLKTLLTIFPRKNILPLIYERHIAGGNLPVGYIYIAKFLGLGVHPINFGLHMGKAFVPRVSFIETQDDLAAFAAMRQAKIGDIVVETIRDSDAVLEPELISNPTPEKFQWYRDFEANITRSLPQEAFQEITRRLFAEDIGATKMLLGDPIPEWD